MAGRVERHWDYPQAAFAGRGGGPAPGGSLKVVTVRMRPGYLRRNGVLYGANAVLTEYFDRLDVPGGDRCSSSRRKSSTRSIWRPRADEPAVQTRDGHVPVATDALRGAVRT